MNRAPAERLILAALDANRYRTRDPGNAPARENVAHEIFRGLKALGMLTSSGSEEPRVTADR